MSVKEMRKLLRNLPPDMEVMMQLNSDTDIVVSVCKEFSGVEEIEIDDDIEYVLFLVPCSCQIETDEIEVIAHLN